ncbi:MAG: GNAT family N-acetyltransferase [Propionibacteriaceae bacterium]|nr:GNAT family N-acetyltransferase [Propionibacteriaceae bacterium]
MTTRHPPGTELRWPDSVPTLIDPERRVLLRAHRPADVPRVVEMCTDPEFVRWTTTPHPYRIADATSFINDFVPNEVDTGRSMIWAIEAIDTASAAAGGTAQFCGSVEIRLQDDGRGEIAFGLHPDARAQGLLRRAGRLALDWAFDVAGLQAVVWRAKVGNWGSRHAAAALGFRFEGVRRAEMNQRGELVDSWTATVLADDPRTSVAPPRQPTLHRDGVVLRPFQDRDVPRIVEACADPISQYWLAALPRDYSVEHAKGFVELGREGAAIFDQWIWCITTAGDPDAGPASDGRAAEPANQLGDQRFKGLVPDECLGAISIRGLADGSEAGELGYWTHPAARGRGLTSAAARVLADFALGETARTEVDTAGGNTEQTAAGVAEGMPDADPLLRSLMIRVAIGNPASQAVARRTGARLIGCFPQTEQLGDGTWTDLLAYTRVRGTG